ncbi:MAG: hypothetical protein JKY43_03060 [Phycisphaerales bacterium]|nr:hypothetical protein [Phycisphaerales bacterium]
MKKIVLITLTFFLLVILTATTWLYFAFLYTKPLTQAQLKNLTPDWSKATQGNWSPWHTKPDGSKTWNPTASFNQWLATIPENQKAWPVLIDIYISEEHLFDRTLLDANPGTDQWNQLTKLLDQPESKATIAQLTEALNRPHFGFALYSSTDQYEHDALIKNNKEDKNWNPNPEQNPSLYNLKNSLFPKLHHTTLLLIASAKHQLINNNPDTFVQQVETLINARKLPHESPNTNSWLIGMAIEGLSYQSISWALQNHPEKLTDKHLASLQSTIGDLSNRTIVWESHALEFHDTFRRIASTNGSLDPFDLTKNLNIPNFISTPPTNLPDSALHHSLQRTLWILNTTAKQATPLSKFNRPKDMPTTKEIYELHKNSLSKFTFLLSDPFIPYLDAVATRNRMHIQNSIAIQLTIAIHRHKLRHNEFPQSIAAIDTDLLPITPTDAFSGQPLKYKLTNTGPIIYSIGDNRIDNGGIQRWTIKDYGQYGSPPLLARIVSHPNWNRTPQETAQLLKDDPDSIAGDHIIFPPQKNDPEPHFDDGD